MTNLAARLAVVAAALAVFLAPPPAHAAIVTKKLGTGAWCW